MITSIFFYVFEVILVFMTCPVNREKKEKTT